MNYVLIHLGSELPEYFEDCVNQIRKYTNDKIYAIIPDSCIDEYKNKGIDNFVIYDNTHFNNNKKSIMFSERAGFITGFGEFWSNAAKRIFVLEQLIKENNLEDVIHLENDVLIYEDLNRYVNIFRECYPNKIALNVCGETETMLACCYIKDALVIEKYTDDFLQILLRGADNLLNTIRNNMKYNKQNAMLNEMTINGLLHSEGKVDSLPTLEYFKNFDKFNSVFDPASFGQNAGGTPNNDPPGFAVMHHYIGREIIDKKIKLEFKDGTPYMIRDNKKIKINNLHIHCKNLKKFRT